MSQTIAVEVRTNRSGQQRAFIAGTRVRVLDVYSLSEVHGKTPDEVVEALPDLTLAQVHCALAYYFDHRAEILQQLREEHETAAKLRQTLGEGPLAAKLSSLN